MDAAVVENAGEAVHHHVSQVGVDVHGKDQRRREEDAVVTERFERVDVHVIEGLWVLVVMMDFVEGSIERSPVQAHVPVVLQQALVDVTTQEAEGVVRQAVLLVVPVDFRMATHNHLISCVHQSQGQCYRRIWA